MVSFIFCFFFLLPKFACISMMKRVSLICIFLASCFVVYVVEKSLHAGRRLTDAMPQDVVLVRRMGHGGSLQSNACQAPLDR